MFETRILEDGRGHVKTDGGKMPELSTGNPTAADGYRLSPADTFSAATHSDMTAPAAEARRAEEVHWRSSVPVLPLYLRPAKAPACVRRGRRCCTRSPVSRSLPTCSMPCAKRAAP